MPAIQTRPINNDQDFLSVRDAINPLMARYGFPLVNYKGSTSWLAGVAYTDHSTETYFKLLMIEAAVSLMFSGFTCRFPERKSRKLKVLRWPVEFAVMPTVDVIFRGS